VHWGVVPGGGRGGGVGAADASPLVDKRLLHCSSGGGSGG